MYSGWLGQVVNLVPLGGPMSVVGLWIGFALGTQAN